MVNHVGLPRAISLLIDLDPGEINPGWGGGDVAGVAGEVAAAVVARDVVVIVGAIIIVLRRVLQVPEILTSA